MKKLIPVVVLKTVEETKTVLEALKDNNINCAEICFRTECAAEAIALAVKEFPDMEIGAGTVINAEQCREALKAGAQFIVSPGFSAGVADVCKEAGISYLPGCATPTEIMMALDHGITTVKFFPADVYGGLKAIKAISAAFPQVRFCPTGGVDRSNIDEFLAFDKIVAVGGSFLVKESLAKKAAK
ncbi:MAG: bifunctional 4-hydroxy-2-oxoglutarate aldolase/2-dehydro-3-deoxy-phosphogluconate aldolase [Bacilli bacterium]|nr:bifunctional 4-hydroxy-2-oxoglutarate aldolase/2-dehydro-3-deoxy-phosphogluconate aldolase [Bacilli bacterium]